MAKKRNTKPFYSGSLAVTVMAYVLAEPGAWTASAIADDLGRHGRGERVRLLNTVSELRSRGLLEPRVPGTYHQRLRATPAGQEAYMRAFPRWKP